MLDIRDLENLENEGRNLAVMLQENGYSKELGDKIEKWMDDVLYNSSVMAHSLYSSYKNYPDYSQKTEDEANKSIYFRNNLSYLSMLIDDTISGCNKKNGTGYLYEGNCYVGDERPKNFNW